MVKIQNQMAHGRGWRMRHGLTNVLAGGSVCLILVGTTALASSASSPSPAQPTSPTPTTTPMQGPSYSLPAATPNAAPMSSSAFEAEVAQAAASRPTSAETFSATINGVPISDTVEPANTEPINTPEYGTISFFGNACNFTWEYGDAFGAALSWLDLTSGHCNTTTIENNGGPPGNGEGLADVQVTADKNGKLTNGPWVDATTFNSGNKYQSTVDLSDLVGNTFSICIEDQLGNPNAGATCGTETNSPY
jgi:hypothetical protein